MKSGVWGKTIKISAYVALGVFLLWLAYGFFFGGNGKNAAAFTLKTALVEKRDISVPIKGSGTIAPEELFEVVPLVKGEIIADHIEEGMVINKDDLLYEIDSGDMANSIDRAKLSLQRANLSQQQNIEARDNLTVKANEGGRIVALYVENGDSVNAGAKIADIADNENLKIRVPFHQSDAQNIAVGSSAQVMVGEYGQTLYGTVERVRNVERVTETGAIVVDVDITVKNPGAVTSGDMATAIVGGYACNSAGTVENYAQTTVVAKNSGDVTGLNLSEGDRVSKDQTILTLNNQSVHNAVESGILSVRDAELSLDNLYQQMDNYKITSPISGKIIKKTYKAGDNIDSSSAKVVLAVVADMSNVKFTINIDELDISKVQTGQHVEVTADALPNKIFTGIVDYVDTVGSSQNGVASYPVTIKISEYEGLLPSMNVNANIIVEHASDVLAIPVAAVSRGDMVLVKIADGKTAEPTQNGEPTQGARVKGGQPVRIEGEGGQPVRIESGEGEFTVSGEGGAVVRSGDVVQAGANPSEQDMGLVLMGGANAEPPEGYRYVKVELGINDENYVEIKSGLSLGDEIGYMVYVNTASVPQSMMGGMGGGGMMGGGTVMVTESRGSNATVRRIG